MKARWVYRCSLGVNVVSALAVLVTCGRVWMVVSSPVDYTINVVEQHIPTNTVYQLPTTYNSYPTNIFKRVSSSVSKEREISDLPPKRYVLSFHVFSDSLGNAVDIGGRYYRPGDNHAYGVISQIWPERIYLKSGDYIDRERSLQTTITPSLSAGPVDTSQ